MTHLLDDLLDNVVSIEVEGAVFYLSLVEELLDHLLLLEEVKNFKACLNNTTSVLVGRIFKHVPFNVVKNDVQILLANALHHLNFLDHVVTKTVKHKLLKSNALILEYRVKKSIFLLPGCSWIHEPLLNEPATPLVLTALKLEA